MKPSRIALAIVVAGLVGLSIFASLAYRAVNVKEALPSEAITRFEAVRQRFVKGFEGYSGDLIGTEDFGSGPRKVLWAEELLRKGIAYIDKAVKALQSILNVEFPLVVMITLGGLENSIIPTQGRQRSMQIETDVLSLPPILVEEEPVSRKALQEVFDVVWQSAGFAEAPAAVFE